MSALRQRRASAVGTESVAHLLGRARMQCDQPPPISPRPPLPFPQPLTACRVPLCKFSQAGPAGTPRHAESLQNLPGGWVRDAAGSSSTCTLVLAPTSVQLLPAQPFGAHTSLLPQPTFWTAVKPRCCRPLPGGPPPKPSARNTLPPRLGAALGVSPGESGAAASGQLGH